MEHVRSGAAVGMGRAATRWRCTRVLVFGGTQSAARGLRSPGLKQKRGGEAGGDLFGLQSKLTYLHQSLAAGVAATRQMQAELARDTGVCQGGAILWLGLREASGTERARGERGMCEPVPCISRVRGQAPTRAAAQSALQRMLGGGR